MIAALLKLRISDQNIPVNFAALEDWNTQCRAQVEYPMGEEIRISSGKSVIAADGERRVITGVGRTPRILCGSDSCQCGLKIRTRCIRSLQRVLDGNAFERFVRRFIGQIKFLAWRKSNHSRDGKLLNREIIPGLNHLLL